MLDLNVRTTVLELQQGPPGLMRALMSSGLFREGDNPAISLGELSWTFGFNPGILLMMLQSANVPEEQPPLDISPYLDMPLLDLVVHIEQLHHEYLRASLPGLTALTAAAAAASSDERLVSLHDETRQLAAELDAHLAHEEEALFPMIRSLAAGVAIAATRCGSSVGGPIACMETEHEAAGRSLQRMRELTDDYMTPATEHEMLQGLRELDQDLREHMYKEDKALFPRAEKAQTEASRKPQPA